MLHASETWPLTKQNLQRLQQNDRAMIRQICNVRPQASYLEGGPLMWMLPLYLHVIKNPIIYIIYIKKYEKYQNFYLKKNFQFLVMKFSIYLNKRVFVMMKRSRLKSVAAFVTTKSGKDMIRVEMTFSNLAAEENVPFFIDRSLTKPYKLMFPDCKTFIPTL